MTHEQATKLLSSLDTPRRKHLHDMVALSLATGLREHNVTRLKWSQVDLERRQIVVEATSYKSGATHRVPLNSAAMGVLLNLHKKYALQGNSDTYATGGIGNDRTQKAYVFTYRGKPIRKANRGGFEAAKKAAGVPWLRWHDLRHTWASWHVQAGTPLAVLKELGGWKTLSMVMRYAHLAPETVAT